MPRDYDDDFDELEDDEIEEVDEYEDDDGFEDDELERGRDRGRRGDGAFKSMVKRVAGEPQRPGEQDVVRSPVILWLTGGSIVVGLLAAILYFMIAKKSAEKQFEFAKVEMDGGKYAQAIELYTEWLTNYPDHELTPQAQIDLGKSRIEKELSGGDPNVGPALTALEDFIKARRDQPDFPDHKNDIRGWARKIVMKAAQKAERTKKQEFLDVSTKAQATLSRFAPEGGFSKEMLDTIRLAQQAAARAILKEETSTETIASIRKMIEDKRPLEALRARRDLVNRFRDADGNLVLENDRELNQLLVQILDTEQKLVAVDRAARDAVTEDRAETATVLTFAAHSRSSTTERSDGRIVFATAADTICGVDAVTGEPQWRRVIGLNTPFTPIQLEASVPALLAFDTNYSELILISQADGSLLWRLPFPGEMVKTPLIHESQIYMPTDQNNMYVVGVGTGRVSAKATFSQPVISPPALSADKDHLVVPGEEEIVYTLKLRPLECIDVAWMGQKAGTIKAPMIKMGRLLMMIENSEVDSSRLRVLRGKPDGTDLELAATASVEGHVYDPPILRGRDLFVASNPQRVTVFTVNDEVGQDPIARVANNQLQDVEPTRMFMVAKPGGELFLAGASLRKFRLQADTLVIDQAETATGIHLQPPQVIGKRFYLTRREPYAQSVYFTEADGDTLTSYWRVVLGAKLLAYAQHDSGLFTAVTDTGATFRVKEEDITNGGFALSAVAQEYHPPGLTQPMGGTRLHDNRLAVYWGDPQPQIVIIGTTGQPSPPIRLPARPETTPVALAGGVVVPVPGALQVVNTNRGARRVTDYRAPQVQGESSRWKSLTRLDDTQVVGIDTKNRMIQVQLRTAAGSPPNLAEVRIVDLDAPIDHPPVQHDRYLLTTDAAAALTVLDARSLEYLATTQLPAVATSPPFGVADRIFVDAGGREILCYQIGNDLKQTGRISSNGATLAGAPLQLGSGFVVALSSGELVLTDGEGNETGERISLGQDLQSGPLQVGNSIVVVGIDGSLLHVDPLLQRSE